ncbi:hypothetical protein OSTOST_03653, partial [Ostertagia ostertagi]
AETTEDKSVIVFSNGQTSTCNQPLFGNEDENDIAKKLRDDGVIVGYVAIGTPANETSMQEVTKDPNNVVRMKNITEKLDPEELDKAVDWLLDLLGGAPGPATLPIPRATP